MNLDEKPEVTEQELDKICEETIENNDGWKTLIHFFPELDLRLELKSDPRLAGLGEVTNNHMRRAIMDIAPKTTDPLKVGDAPKFDDDFTNYFVINNLPVCAEEKITKLKGLIKTTFTKKGITVEDEKIDISLDPSTGQTYGVAFIEMRNEEQARLGAALFNDFKLGKLQLATCMLPEFGKIMQTDEDFVVPKAAADLQDLRAPVFDTKREQYLIKYGKNIKVNFFDRQLAINQQESEEIIDLENVSDRKTSWSPQGTYLIIIKPGCVQFCGGSSMVPIITLNQGTVEAVSMSPCEKYVLTYAPKADFGFTVWDFQMVSEIRTFELETDETADSFKWSQDGSYIAKKFKKQLDSGRVKEGVTVYELPSMEIIKDSAQKKTSITIGGIYEWHWAPARNMIVYTAHLDEVDENDLEAVAAAPEPKIGFIEVPSRNVLCAIPVKGARELTLTFHPLGNYLAVINRYKIRKQEQYTTEIFDLTKRDSVPQQQIVLDRQIENYRGVHWEPVTGNCKIALHTFGTKDKILGKKEYTLKPERDGVDVFEMQIDADTKAMTVKKIGPHANDRVVNFEWSPAGDVFAAAEKDGPGLYAKTIWSFYMIEQKVETEKKPKKIQQIVRGKGGKHQDATFSKVGLMESKDEIYEFKKTARHETVDAATNGIWDEYGRFFVVYGVKAGPQQFGKAKDKFSVKVYSIFGEPLLNLDKITDFTQFEFRPHPKNLLSKKELKDLKANARKKYKEKYNAEEGKYREEVEIDVNTKKKEIRDEFMDNFFLPLRQKYEDQIEKYIELWPLKDDQMHEEEITVTHVYQYGDLLEKKEFDTPNE